VAGTKISAGKWRRLRALTDEGGRFKMMAIDQRGSLAQAIGRATGVEAQQVNYQALADVKRAVTKMLAPQATAVLTDPVYGYPYSIQDLPPRVGLLLAYEGTGYNKAGPLGKDRESYLIDGWSVAKAQRAGADAVKLLLYYHPESPEDVRRHQQELVGRVGEECEGADMPFLLELVAYSREGSADSAEFARKKPQLVIASAAEFSQAKYRVDILKLEFPADLKWTREYSRGAFDGKDRDGVYSLSQVREVCQRLDEASGMPWVILSAGVDIEEFLVQVDLAVEAGASGFLCGRAIWKDAVPIYPDMQRMELWLSTQGSHNLSRANSHAGAALPWTHHRKFGGAQNMELSCGGENWYAEFAGAIAP
jgi:tagatose 1,6-diphosphate aldolase